MDFSQQLKQLGITTSHYDIDGNLIYAKAETLDYFTALFSSASLNTNSSQFDDVWLINADQAIDYDLQAFQFTSLVNATLFDEQKNIVFQQKVQHSIAIPSLHYGYYQLELQNERIKYVIRLLVQPKTTYQSPLLQHHKPWGINVQLYSLVSERNWGIGDFADLQFLIKSAVRFGVDFIGINPLHKLYAAVPEWASPYSASSRRWLNPIYLAIDLLPEFKLDSSVQYWWQNQKELLEQLRCAENVDYTAVSQLKMTALKQMFDFQRTSINTNIIKRRQSFLAYVKQQGQSLLDQALFDVLDCLSHQTMPEDENQIGWLGWRKEWQNLDTEQRQSLHQQYQQQVEFYAWLQWLTEQQLAETQQLALQSGMKLGIYGDLAVQSSRGSADVWIDPELYCVQASIGAPPDPLGPVGQNWNLPPYNPAILKNRGFQPVIDLLRANMQHFGVLRIDHVMGLFRLWLIPEDKTAADGLYVLYPFDKLMAILAIESQRNQCVIVGEDLGTVPDEVRSKLNEFLIFSYFVLYFSQRNDQFPTVEDFPQQAFATIGTHDVPSLRSFWHCNDLELFAQLGILEGEFLQQKYHQRVIDKQALLNSLHRDHYLPPNYQGDAMTMAMHDHLNFVIHCYLAQSQSKLVGVQLENLIDQELSFNLPGTSTEYPNWRKKLKFSLEQIFTDQRICSLLTEINQQRHSN